MKAIIIVGPSSSGKSTAARLIAGLLPPADCTHTDGHFMNDLFGLTELYGRRVAVFDEPKFTKPALKKLCTILDGQEIEIARKGKPTIKQILFVQIVIVWNLESGPVPASLLSRSVVLSTLPAAPTPHTPDTLSL